jgi:hypothetical protein
MTETVLPRSLETYAVKALASPLSIINRHAPSKNRVRIGLLHRLFI